MVHGWGSSSDRVQLFLGSSRRGSQSPWKHTTPNYPRPRINNDLVHAINYWARVSRLGTAILVQTYMASLSSSCIKCGNNDTHVRLQLKTYGKSLICSDFPDIAVFAVKFPISRLSRSISRYRDRDGQIPDFAVSRRPRIIRVPAPYRLWQTLEFVKP